MTRETGSDPVAEVSTATSVDHVGLLFRVQQAGVAALAGVAVIGVRPGLLVNSLLALAATGIPEAVHRKYGRPLGTVVAVWVSTAALLHAVGALGPYATVPFYDRVAHVVSASLVAGVGYAIVAALDAYSPRVRFPSRFRAVFVVMFVLAVGVAWELLEFAVGGVSRWLLDEAVIVQYGLEDTVGDLVFDALGAVVVAIVGTERFRGLVRVILTWLGRE